MTFDLRFENAGEYVQVPIPEELRGGPVEVTVLPAKAKEPNEQYPAIPPDVQARIDALTPEQKKFFDKLTENSRRIEQYYRESGINPEPWKFNREEIYDRGL